MSTHDAVTATTPIGTRVIVTSKDPRNGAGRTGTLVAHTRGGKVDVDLDGSAHRSTFMRRSLGIFVEPVAETTTEPVATVESTEAVSGLHDAIAEIGKIRAGEHNYFTANGLDRAAYAIAGDRIALREAYWVAVARARQANGESLAKVNANVIMARARFEESERNR